MQVGELVKVHFTVNGPGAAAVRPDLVGSGLDRLGGESPWAEVVSVRSPTQITAKLTNEPVLVDYHYGDILPFVDQDGIWEFEVQAHN